MNDYTISIVGTSVSLMFGVLAGCAFFEFANPAGNVTLLAVVAGTLLAVFLMGTIGFASNSRTLVSVRALSAVFVLICAIVNIIFAFFEFRDSLLIIINFGLITIWFMSVYSISRTRDSQH